MTDAETDSEGKRSELQQIADEIRNLTESPLYDYRQEHGYSPVVGEGDPDARVMFIGEAPGKEEARTGRPFVGAAGRILEALFESVGLSRDEVYITNVVKDRPPENRDIPGLRKFSSMHPFCCARSKPLSRT